MALRVRRRFIYPAIDVFTENPTLDLLLDDASRWFRGRRGAWSHDRATIMVMGFPRSGNTFLTFWLRQAAGAGVTILDGRATHSVLDLHRMQRAGVPVIIPVREPIATVSSFMVRQGKPDSLEAARRKLRAYAGWYRVAMRAVCRDGVIVSPFAVTVNEPELLRRLPRLAPMLTEEVAESSSDLLESMAEEMVSEPGQGLGVGDIPAHWMVSVPTPERDRVTARARALVEDPRVERERAQAIHAYAMLLDRARACGALVGTGSVDVLT